MNPNEYEYLLAALTDACSTGQLFVIRNFLIQQSRSPYTKWVIGSDDPDNLHMGTAVIFGFVGANRDSEGLTAFAIDVDHIDAFCEALQIAKQADVASIDDPNIQHAQIRFNQPKPGE